MFESRLGVWKTGGAVLAVAFAAATAGSASTVTGSVTLEISDGAFTTGVFDSDTGGAATSASTNIGYTVNLTGTGVLTNTLSSTTTIVPQGWIASGNTTVTGVWNNPPAQLSSILQNNSVSVSRSLSLSIPLPFSFEGLGSIAVAPGGSVTFDTALAALLGFAAPAGGTFTFGGGQGILPSGDTIEGSIDFVSGAFDLTVTGNDAVASLQTQAGFLGSLGIAPSSTLTSIFGAPEDWDRSVLAFLPDSGSFTAFASVQPIPLPGALPLMAGGLGLLGFMGWRRKRAAT